MRRILTICGLALLAGPALAPGSAAQTATAKPAPPPPPQTGNNAPVYYQADDVQYDREAGIVTATGHVEAWQNDRTIRADKFVYDRNTGVAAATGHVVLQEASGEVVFSDYAELTQDMKTGVLSGMRAQLSQNGRLVANGARRTDAKINELTRAVYSTCNLCAQDPTRAPLWDIRAREAVQDIDNKRIEYRDAIIDFYGIPVMYLPYLTHPDPSQKRASGLLVPSFGFGSSHLGAFLMQPYYQVIDGQSDVTISPMLTTQAGEAVFVDYRRRFNSGTLKIASSISNEYHGLQGHIFAKGQFVLDDVWRWGFDINRASSQNYVRDYRIAPNALSLASSIYLEGFGQGAYSRLDVRTYQSLSTTISNKQLPSVLPRYQYSYFGQPDALGGRLALDAGAFNVVREQGTNTQRLGLRANWDRPFTGPVGDLWKVGLHLDTAGYSAHGLSQIPNYVNLSSAHSVQAMPTASLEGRWPLARQAGSWGTQVIEPIFKVMASPRGQSYASGKVPNEDSLDLEFTDASLFNVNRYPGIDRLEGGLRAAAALHFAWYMPSGGTFDALVGQSYRAQKDSVFPTGSGLENTVSDVVSHVSYTPNGNFDITSRQRFDRKNFNVRFADAIVSGGVPALRLNAGYIYSYNNPYTYYDTPLGNTATTLTPRNEVTAGASTKFGVYKLHGDARYDVQFHKLAGINAGGSYEDECFIFDVQFYRRYTSLNNDGGDTGLLFSVTLKTVGEFGFHGL